MKSVIGAGRKFSSVWVAPAMPRPVFSPEPIAISDSWMLYVWFWGYCDGLRKPVRRCTW